MQPEARVLDIGCGAGILLTIALSQFFYVTGVKALLGTIGFTCSVTMQRNLMKKVANLLVALFLFGHVAIAQTRPPLLSEPVQAPSPES